LFADVLIVFIVRISIQFFRSLRAKSWPVVKAKVTMAERSGGGFGCMVVELVYDYDFNGKYYSGNHSEPFLSAGAAKEYLEEHSTDTELLVRLDPGNPDFSVVRDRDLYFHAHGYRLDS
jgi:hypothetical protein